MFAANVSKVLRTTFTQNSRNMSVLSGPPTEKISGAEKAAHGLAIAIGILTIPAWVLVNIKNYRAKA